jgi:hypothetical protein
MSGLKKRTAEWPKVSHLALRLLGYVVLLLGGADFYATIMIKLPEEVVREALWKLEPNLFWGGVVLGVIISVALIIVIDLICFVVRCIFASIDLRSKSRT